MNDTTQLGHIQDTLNEHGSDIRQLKMGFDEMTKDLMKLDRNYTQVNEHVIRLDEKIKGIRDQNTNHHRVQVETDNKLSEQLNTLLMNNSILMSAMGLDPKNDTSVQEMRKDFFAVRETRVNKKSYKEHLIKALITAATITLISIVASLLYLGVQTQLRKDMYNYDHQSGVNQNGPKTTIPQLRDR